MTEYHVGINGDDTNIGDAAHPFATISRAAALAVAGDTVTVHEGVYRESVDPARGGLSDQNRIVYQGAPGERRPIIKGSERIAGWRQVDGHPSVWQVSVSNSMFGDFNPFAEIIFGDWLEAPKRGHDPIKHLGDVYLNGRSFYEVTDLADVYEPVERTTVKDNALGFDCPVIDPDQTRYVWHASVDAASGTTTITANFHDHDPNEELVEISVRRTCFFPSRNFVNYITVRGFEMCQAACDWAPPTSRQWGMVGPNWSCGWIIEDNVLHDAKFSAVSLGKEISSGDNEWWRTDRKTGYQYQLEAVFKGLRVGWKRGQVGSHIVRNNDIHDCGQNGVVGHMGCAFSLIEHNHIHHIGLKREFFGWEVAGIKFHAALDTVIAHNNIHDCSLGMWLDWQAQGTRVTGNVFHRNVRDLMIEVSHGPYLVDDNIFASDIMFQNWSQGGAFVNNLICGSIETHTVPDRSTPYHFPHTTEVAGCAVVSGGDERYLNNIFAPQHASAPIGAFGLAEYAKHPVDKPEYSERVRRMWLDPQQGGGERNPLQPLYAGGNLYLTGAQAATDDGSVGGAPVRNMADLPYFGGLDARETAADTSMPISLTETDDGLYLECEIPEAVAASNVPVVTTATLGTPRIVEELYEHADGTPYVLDTDMTGERAVDATRHAGPLESLVPGHNRIKVW
ncbi:right-handed parallel beta-helix repeat-containing protein [Bifidobacterium simiiventris]|uniref:right-handed parallel beta-helix repeat-containing protein n=1 Tax=Bifidobacterium simiiventris TaxID=2834434 RepID=UPI001C599F45|nr:right-handed parallel beta-helix repeat-containing protein [Bifidobacterium simiiventris]MBW3078051.1 right-handed parallel beta-helix repeat-containing protein [Bifidobacterium simiiventris]